MELFRYTFGTIFSLGKNYAYRRFSMRFVEPAGVVSMTYIDPGNWGPT
jgi:Mn2+/Fe2+ NRAMP family transporter